MDGKALKLLSKERDSLIASLYASYNVALTSAQTNLYKQLADDILDKLEFDEDGKVINNAKNRNILVSVDKFFQKWNDETNPKILSTMIDAVQQIMAFNHNYFSKFTEAPRAELIKLREKALNNVKGWLGVDGDTINKNGYLDTLVKNDTIKNKIKDSLLKTVYAQEGWRAAKETLKVEIEGDKSGKLGSLVKYHRNFSYDLYSQIDRATGKTYADDLKFECAIYEGGLIETSREFCKERNGKVFHISEIKKMKPEKAIPANYNPLFDMGGYACRHHWNWIPPSLAIILRPDIKSLIGTDVKEIEETKPTEKKPTEKKPEKPKETKPIEKPIQPEKVKQKTPFDEIEVMKIETIPTPKNWSKYDKTITSINDKENELKSINNELVELNKKIKAAKGYEQMQPFIEAYNEKAKSYNVVLKENKIIIDKLKKESAGEFQKMIDSIPVKNEAITITKIGDHPDADRAVEMFRKIAAKYDLREDYTIKLISGRAHYSTLSNTVNVSKTDDIGVIIHEFAHSLENNNFILKQAVEFLERRTAKSKVEKLKKIHKGYRADEVFKRGGFYSPYVGKLYRAHSPTTRNYKGLAATEVISMGLEQMYNNPVRFKMQDREHYELIYNLFFK